MNRRDFLKAIAVTPLVAGVLANLRKPKPKSKPNVFYNGMLQREGHDYEINANGDAFDWKTIDQREGDHVVVHMHNSIRTSALTNGLTWRKPAKRFPLWAKESDAFFHEVDARAYVYTKGRWRALTSKRA